MKGRINNGILLLITAGYALIILWYTVLNRTVTLQSAQFELFWSYKEWIQGDWEMGSQVLGNIALFIPFGFLCTSIMGRHSIIRAVLTGFLLSCLVETLQYFGMRGLFELDDLLNNSVGAFIGGVLYTVLRRIISARLSAIITAGVGIFSVITGFSVCCLSDSAEADQSTRQYCFQVDTVEARGDSLFLSGFGFRYDEPDKPIQLLLKSSRSFIPLEVESGIERQDVERYFSGEKKYSKTGFKAAASGVSYREEYEIFINLGWPMSVSTGVYITGNLVHYSPSASFSPPQGGEDLQEIVEKGTLRVYRPDFHCWVYQYEGYLYWIADQDFFFEDDGTTYIQYQLWTTRPDKLPSRRLDNNWSWDNIGGDFEEYETEGDFGRYRVMRRKLPSGYPITSILTGYYKNGNWIWRNCFRPVYEFFDQKKGRRGSQYV